MSQDLLNKVIVIRKKLQNVSFQAGEVTGNLILNKECIELLKDLAVDSIVEDTITIDAKTILLEKVSLEAIPISVIITIYTFNLKGARYYESLNQFIASNYKGLPAVPFYIQDENYFSSDQELSLNLKFYLQVIELIELLSGISDYQEDVDGEYFKLVFFEKKKISLVTRFTSNQLRDINDLKILKDQFNNAHDREQRIEIFRTEMVNFLFGYPEDMRLGVLIMSFDQVYTNYVQSHFLYLEKFSYYDIKAQVDKDKLDYVKKIASTVNDIQSKMIAVPAAFLLTVTLFDFTQAFVLKNTLIIIACLLFALLLEVLLTSQFDVLKYTKTEIKEIEDQLTEKNKEEHLNGLIQSFSGMNNAIQRQKFFLWVFRFIVWAVPVTFLICALARM